MASAPGFLSGSDRRELGKGPCWAPERRAVEPVVLAATSTGILRKSLPVMWSKVQYTRRGGASWIQREGAREGERDGDVDEQCQAEDRLRTYLGQEDREVSLCFCLQGDHLPERMARMARSCHECSEYTCYACCFAEAVLCDHKASALWPDIAHWHSPKKSHLCLRGRVSTRSNSQGSGLERERSSKSSCPNLLNTSHVNFRGVRRLFPRLLTCF